MLLSIYYFSMIEQYPLFIGIVIFLITVIEYKFNAVLIGKIRLRILKREENPRVFFTIIIVQIVLGGFLIAISLYNIYF